jgi:hypothetical protein
MATVLVQLEGQGEHPGQIGNAPATPARFQALPVGPVHHAVPHPQFRASPSGHMVTTLIPVPGQRGFDRLEPAWQQRIAAESRTGQSVKISVQGF